MTDPQPWKTLRTEMVLDLRWYKVRREEVQLPDGRILDDYYVSVRPEVALVFPVTPAGEVIMVRQYKHGAREILLELPGGVCDPGEPPEASARRELLEETGYAAGRLTHLATLHDDPTKNTNRFHLFLAEGVEYDYDEVNERGNRHHHVAILRGGTQEQPFIFYDQDIHRATDAETAEALAALDALLESKAQSVKLEAGDTVLFDNRRCVHKRSPFTALYDGEDRWCMLTYVSSSALECTREKVSRRRILDIPATI